ncbi:MAG TPA: glucose 1-dehydrogenase [Acidimicrobiales bacterium]|jgi:7-alpha-hydroxysteroid dehydrogenase
MPSPPTNTQDLFRLEGKVAIVTGAGKGIGAAIARAYADAGADVALMSRTASDLEAVADDVTARGQRALVLPGDMNDFAVLAELVSRTVGELGGLDVVVNNAGGSQSHPFLDTTVQQLEASFRFNVFAPFELSRLAAPHLLDRPGASIINISSMAGRNAPRGQLAHGTTKAALSQLTRLMAADLAPRIRVNAILPGAVETESLGNWLSSMGPNIRQTMIQRTAMRRNGAPDDIAAAAVYLAAPAASWVTGKLLEVDGSANPELVPKPIDDL